MAGQRAVRCGEGGWEGGPARQGSGRRQAEAGKGAGQPPTPASSAGPPHQAQEHRAARPTHT